MKTCVKCLGVKPLSSFSRSSVSDDGLQKECIPCRVEMNVKAARKEENATFKRIMAERAEDAREAAKYVSAARSTTRCGQCNHLGVEFYYFSRDRNGKFMVAGFTTMGDIDSRIDDMVPMCHVCKPLIEKGKLKTHLFD